jgi:hypothetical protein
VGGGNGTNKKLEETDMPNLLPPLHEGHAPIFLHLAFEDALEAFENWRHAEPEPLVDCDGKPTAISSVFGRMRTCTDVMPVRIFDDVQALVDDPHLATLEGPHATYAEAARILRAHCVERLKV